MGWTDFFRRKSKETMTLMEATSGSEARRIELKEQYSLAKVTDKIITIHEKNGKNLLSNIQGVFDTTKKHHDAALAFLLRAKEGAKDLPAVVKEVGAYTQMGAVLNALAKELSVSSKFLMDDLDREMAQYGQQQNLFKKEHQDLQEILNSGLKLQGIAKQLHLAFHEINIEITDDKYAQALDKSFNELKSAAREMKKRNTEQSMLYGMTVL